MKENRSIMLLGITAIIAIIILVMIFQKAITGEVVRRYQDPNLPVMYPTSMARLYCELPEPRLDLTQEECRRIGWDMCAEMHGTRDRITGCQQFCGREIANICMKAYGDYGIGIKYTREPHLGLRRPVNT